MAVVLVWACACACGARSPLDGPSSQTDGPDASADASAPSGVDDVTGTIVVHYATDSGVVDRGLDLSSTPVAALVEQADGTFTTFSGAGQANGQFVVPGVPPAPFDLRFGPTPTHTVLVLVHPARQLSLSAFVAGRPDAVRLPGPGQAAEGVELRVTNLAPWQQPPPFPYAMWMVSSNAAVLGGFLELTPAPAAGQTSLYDVHAEVQANTPIDAMHGDRATVLQIATHTQPNGESDQTIVRALDVPSPELLPATPPSTIEGSFVVVPTDQRLGPTRLDLARLGLYAPQLAPGAKPSQVSLGVSAFPGQPAPGLALPLYTLTARSQAFSVPLAGQSVTLPGPDSVSALAFGNPFPGWSTWVSTRVVATSTVRVPDGEGGTYGFAEAGILTHFGRFESFTGPLEPTLAPPSDVRIDGRDAFATQSGVGVAPTFTWTAATSLDPGFGAGSIVYELTISPLAFDAMYDAGTYDQQRSSMVLRTSETSVLVPSGTLVPGRPYFATVTAIAVPGPDPANPAFDSATVWTAAFLP